MGEYFEAVGVCEYKYAHGGSPGQKGGYLLKCTAPSGFAMAVGQTQSALCEAEDGSNYTVGPTTALQMNIDPSLMSDCEYCKMKDDNLLECDGSWSPISCPAQSAVYLEDRSVEGYCLWRGTRDA